MIPRHSPNGRRTSPGSKPFRRAARSRELPGHLRYAAAAIAVIVATAAVAGTQSLASFPPLARFIVAISVSAAIGGAGPGVLALILSTVATDFFFITPAFELSFNWEVLRLGTTYGAGSILGLLIGALLRRGTVPR